MARVTAFVISVSAIPLAIFWLSAISSKLNLGVRYEYELPTYDSHNANVRGFDPTAAIGIAGAAQAAYAKNRRAHFVITSK